MFGNKEQNPTIKLLEEVLDKRSNVILQIPQNNFNINIKNLKEIDIDKIDENWNMILNINIKDNKIFFEIQCKIERYMQDNKIEMFIKKLFKKHDAHRLIEESENQNFLKITLDERDYENNEEMQNKTKDILNELLNNISYFNYLKITKEVY
jgi:hypothetical protein